METFLVQVWVPAPEFAEIGRAPEMRGVVEHVRTGRRQTFSGPEELLALIGSLVRETGGASSGPDRSDGEHSRRE